MTTALFSALFGFVLGAVMGRQRLISVLRPTRPTKIVYSLALIVCAGSYLYWQQGCAPIAFGPLTDGLCDFLTSLASIETARIACGFAAGLAAYVLFCLGLTLNSQRRWYEHKQFWLGSFSLAALGLSALGADLQRILNEVDSATITTPFLSASFREGPRTGVLEISFDDKREEFQLESIVSVIDLDTYIVRDIDYQRQVRKPLLLAGTSNAVRRGLERIHGDILFELEANRIWLHARIFPVINCLQASIDAKYNTKDIELHVRKLARELRKFSDSDDESAPESLSILFDSLSASSEYFIVNSSGDAACEKLKELRRYYSVSAESTIADFSGHGHSIVLSVRSDPWMSRLLSYLQAAGGNIEGALQTLENQKTVTDSSYAYVHQLYLMKYYANRPYRELLGHVDDAIKIVRRQQTEVDRVLEMLEGKQGQEKRAAIVVKSIKKRLQNALRVLKNDYSLYSARSGLNKARALSYVRELRQYAEKEKFGELANARWKYAALLDTATFVELAFEVRRDKFDREQMAERVERALNEFQRLSDTVAVELAEVGPSAYAASVSLEVGEHIAFARGVLRQLNR